jgi:hypothetical protein
MLVAVLSLSNDGLVAGAHIAILEGFLVRLVVVQVPQYNGW